MNKGLIIAVVAVVILLAGGFLVLQGNSAPSPTPTEAPLTVGTPSTEESQTQTGSTASPLASSIPEATGQNIIEYTDTGFSPTTLTIKVGDSVTWKNSGSATIQVSSDPHPTHTDYPPLNSVGAVAPGSSKSFTFTKAGTYGYHDHLNPSAKGTVIVK